MATPSVFAGNGIWRVLVITIVAMVIYYLLSRHPAYAFAVIPYVLILACLAMHLLEDHRHRKRGRPDKENSHR